MMTYKELARVALKQAIKVRRALGIPSDSPGFSRRLGR